MQASALQDIGLTDGEVKVYYALVSLGTTKTGPLAKEARVSSSKVYKILDRLEKKGLVGHVMRGEVKHFSALDPNRILDYIDERQQELQSKRTEVEQIIPQIRNALTKPDKQSDAAVLDGFKACTNQFRSMLDELKPGDTYHVIGASYGQAKGLHAFFHNHHLRRTEKKIHLRMLANYDTKQSMEPPTKRLAQIRFLPQFLVTNMEIVFYHQKAFIVLWTEQPTGFLIKNEEAVKSFQAYFETLWKIAKQ